MSLRLHIAFIRLAWPRAEVRSRGRAVGSVGKRENPRELDGFSICFRLAQTREELLPLPNHLIRRVSRKIAAGH
jgi:hypothetical protein